MFAYLNIFVYIFANADLTYTLASFNITVLVPKVNTVRPITKNPQNKGGDAGRLDELTNQIAEFKVISVFFCVALSVCEFLDHNRRLGKGARLLLWKITRHRSDVSRSGRGAESVNSKNLRRSVCYRGKHVVTFQFLLKIVFWKI